MERLYGLILRVDFVFIFHLRVFLEYTKVNYRLSSNNVLVREGTFHNNLLPLSCHPNVLCYHRILISCHENLINSSYRKIYVLYLWLYVFNIAFNFITTTSVLLWLVFSSWVQYIVGSSKHYRTDNCCFSVKHPALRQPQVIKFNSCLPMVGGSHRVFRLLPPLKLVAMI
jgi:hypothetical protein